MSEGPRQRSCSAGSPALVLLLLAALLCVPAVQGQPSESPSSTPSPTASFTASVTPTRTASRTATPSRTVSPTPYISSTPAPALASAWRACPPDQPGLYWTQLTNNTCTAVTSLVSSFGWEGGGANALCRSASCRCGPYAQPAVLRSPADAAALSSLLPPAAGSAWVGLNVTLNSTTGVPIWAWSDDSSAYGLADAAAWVFGGLPAASSEECARLRSDRKLESVSCNLHTGKFPSACTIPACRCADAGTCTTAVRGPDGNGYVCHPAYPRLHVASAHVFQQHTLTGGTLSTIPSADSLAAGCGQLVNSSTLDTGEGSSAMRIVAGDVLRLCGLFPAGASGTALTFPTLASSINAAQVRACDRSLGLQPTACLEVVLARPVSSQGSVMLAPLALGQETSCSVIRPLGLLRCWGTNAYGQTSVPPDLPPVLAVAAGSAHTCVVLGDRTARCWGFNDYGQTSVPPDLGRVLALAAGDGHTCAIREGGSVRCWGGKGFGETAVPGFATGAAALTASYEYTCAVLSGAQAGSFKCWGNVPSLSALPALPVQQVATGQRHVCVLTAGAGSVHCSGSEVSAFPSASLPPVAALSAGFGFTCAIFAANGAVQCWGKNDWGQLNVPPGLGPMARLSSYYQHTCGVEVGSGRVVCWGKNSIDQSSPPVDTRGAPLRAPSLQSSPMLLSDSASAVLLSADLAAPLQFIRLNAADANTVVVQLQRAKPNSTVPIPPAFLFSTQSDLRYPVLYTYTQADLGGAVARQNCMLTQRNASSYELQCASSSFLYGVEALVFDGQSFQRVAVWEQPGSAHLNGASLAVSLATAGLPPSNLDLAAVTGRISNATLSARSPLVLQVRPGDAVTLLGAGFGLHPRVQQVPWWAASVQGQLRSCIHLAWWASTASYHNDSACVCNGLEDWLGEGELPLSAITAWNDTLITFTAPLAEGIREVRLCVEGLGLDSAVLPPRSSSSIYLAWDPPVLENLLPAAYVESTDADTDVSLQLVMAGDLGISVPVWGTCDAMFTSAADGRAWYTTPLPTNVSFALLRHCTATPYVQDSLGRCSVGAGYQTAENMWPLGSRPAANCTPGIRWMQPRAEGVLTVSASTSFQVPLLQPMPNAVLNATVRVSIWDGGILISAAESSSSQLFTRSPPLIKSCSPNPLLLGPVGGISTQEGAQATLTLYGVGFRTPAEVLNPRNGLTTRPSSAEVLVAGKPCLNVSVTRSSKRFAVVTCTYPSWAVGGGTLPVTLRMIGVETTLSVDDGSTVALSTQCAAGYYGQFDVVGHQVCRPCPAGGECRGGVGRAPLAQPGFYNMGLPSRAKLNESDTQVQYMSVSAVPGAVCPPGSSDGGRDLACVLPCEPQDACLGGNVCAEGYVSVPPVFRCARCAPRYYRSSGVCVPCPVIGLGAILLLAAALVAACGAMLLLSSNAIRLCTVSTVLEYAQIISLMQGPTIPWPPAVKYALRTLSILRVNVEVSAPECYSSISLTPEAKLWAVVLLPVVVLSLSAAVFLGLALCKRLCLRRRIRHSPGLADAPGSGGALASLLAGDVWSHGPSCCRTALKLLDMLYLPVVNSSLEVWNCTPTDPPDGKEYLSVVFEECGLPGGLQARMAPWAIAGLVAYGALYPALLALFFVWNHDLLMLDQLLRAAGTGDDKRSNPRAHLLRQYAAPLYEDYRPGCQYGALLSLARRALVCICALMLNKSPQLQCSAIVFVVAVVLTLQSTFRPLMTPGAGYVAALAQYSSQLQMRPTDRESKLHRQLTEIAERTRLPKLVQLSAGHAVCTDLDTASRPWWTTLAVDWNFLECELQLQVLLTGQLAMMYNAALSSVYAARAVPAVTAMFFLLITVALCHIAVTVGYDLLLQVRRVALPFLGPRAQVIASSESSKQVIGEVEDVISSIPTWRMFLVVFCPCAMSRARARFILTGRKDSRGDGDSHRDTSLQPGHARAGVTDWLSNPLDVYRPQGVAATCRARPEHEAHGTLADGGAASASRALFSYASDARASLPPFPTSLHANST